MISFHCTKEELHHITRIADRFMQLAPNHDRLTLEMDLCACHANGTPLRLRDLENAAILDFMHDICGITNHLDRKTGHLTGLFHPRYAVQQ